MKKTLSLFLGLTIIFASFAFVLPVLATSPNWDTSGDHHVNIEYQGTNYEHDVTLLEDSLGNLSGNGANRVNDLTYLWHITSGTVVDDVINFTANYATASNSTSSQPTIIVRGMIADNGTMSGTWSDNYGAANRSGAWATASGTAMMSHSGNSSTTVTVTIEKFVQGRMATASSARNTDFPMTATWSAQNTGTGTGSYVLSETNTVAYQAVTTKMTKGANYKTEETLTGDSVATSCSAGKPFALTGYTTGDSKVAAMNATSTMNKPTFTNLQQNKFVIVWNRDCALGEGEISGEVVTNDGVLEVTSIEMIDTTARANGSFTDGWKYVFHITAPMSEENLSMKFNDWQNSDGGTIPVAGNMRISSLEATNGSTTILLLGANMYSTPELHMMEDLNPALTGRQVDILVEVAVPNNTPNGTYSTSYGVRSNP